MLQQTQESDREREETICEQISLCHKCLSYVYSSTEHRCGEVECGSCHQWDNPNNHQWRCFMQAIEDVSVLVYAVFLNYT